MGTNLGVSKDSFRFDHLLERLIELTGSGMLNQPKEEMHREKSGKVPDTELPWSSGMCYLPGTSMHDNRQSTSNQRSPPKRRCQNFNGGFVT